VEGYASGCWDVGRLLVAKPAGGYTRQVRLMNEAAFFAQLQDRIAPATVRKKMTNMVLDVTKSLR